MVGLPGGGALHFGEIRMGWHGMAWHGMEWDGRYEHGMGRDDIEVWCGILLLHFFLCAAAL